MSRWLLVLALFVLATVARHHRHGHGHPHRTKDPQIKLLIDKMKSREQKIIAAEKRKRRKGRKRDKGLLFGHSYDDILPRWDLRAAHYRKDDLDLPRRLKRERKRRQRRLLNKERRPPCTSVDCTDEHNKGSLSEEREDGKDDALFGSPLEKQMEEERLDGAVFEISLSEESFDFPIIAQSWHFGSSAVCRSGSKWSTALAVGLGLAVVLL